MEKSSPKIVVIGLDGATFDIIDPLIQAGRLPHLKSLLQSGTRAVLNSTTPPITGCAWVTMMTGISPGGHGIYGFTNPVLNTFGEYVGLNIGANVCTGRTFSETMAKACDTKVASLFVPMTYPVWAIKGLMVAGRPAPDKGNGFVHPKELYSEYRDCNFQTDYFTLIQTDLDKFAGLSLEMMKRRGEKISGLVASKDYGSVFAVFAGTDVAQHPFWKYFDPESNIPAAKREQYKDIIPAHYVAFDEQLGNILEAADPDTSIFVLSDHGAGPSPQLCFNTNYWLKHNGFLHQKKQSLLEAAISCMTRLMKKYLVTQQLIAIRNKLPGFLLSSAKKVAHGFGNIDFSRTYAFRTFMDYPNEGIVINVRGRQIDGIVAPKDRTKIVKDIIEKITDAVDPDTGKKLVIRAQPREEVYSGEFVEKAPDIILTLDWSYMGNGDVSALCSSAPSERPSFFSGNHRYNGIFVAKGPNIRNNAVLDETLNMQDIAPTVLAAAGISPPSYMDGVVAEDIFESAEIPQQDLIKATEKGGPSKKVEVSEAEEEEMTKKLKGLGYL